MCYNQRMNKKKIIIVSCTALCILLVAAIIYRQPIKEHISEFIIRYQTARIIQGYYEGHVQVINNNTNWIDLIEKYTASRAKSLTVARINFFLYEASQGRQRLVAITSPIKVRFINVSPVRVKALVDFDFEERIIGGAPVTDAIKRTLILEVVDNKLLITEELERTDRFNEWANQQDFLTMQLN